MSDRPTSVQQTTIVYCLRKHVLLDHGSQEFMIIKAFFLLIQTDVAGSKTSLALQFEQYPVHDTLYAVNSKISSCAFSRLELERVINCYVAFRLPRMRNHESLL